MRIAHVSDNHGLFITLPGGVEAVVHSGDFCTNRSRTRVIEESFQPMWLRANAEKIKRWLGGKPILLTHGNHDFVNVIPILQEMGIEAIGLDDTVVDFRGVRFTGFPYVPAFTREWNFECEKPELEARTEAIPLKGVDVLVTHSPIYGVLDRNAQGERCGSLPLRTLLQDTPHLPKWLMHGHIHESNGFQAWSRGLQISNAATTSRVIDLT